MPTSIPDTVRRELEVALRHLRIALTVTRYDLSEAFDPEERVHLTTLVDDIAGCIFVLERRLHPAGNGGQQ